MGTTGETSRIDELPGTANSVRDDMCYLLLLRVSGRRKSGRSLGVDLGVTYKPSPIGGWAR